VQRNLSESRRETNLPATPAKKDKQAWLSGAHGHQERPKGTRPPEGQRASPANGQRRKVIPTRSSKIPGAHLQKQEILRGYGTFSRVIGEGETLQKGAVQCFFILTRQTRASLKVGFAVSRSVRTAIERNRLRRWMKEAYRKNRSLLSHRSELMHGAMDAVFLLRVRGGLPRRRDLRMSVDQAMVALLKELHQHLSKKP
jgi:ribonuclease P protein component